jgi:hypothetical protein
MLMMDNNQITPAGKIVAGVLLIFFTALPLFLIIGLWPDQMPEPKGSQLYSARLFHVSLIKDSTVLKSISTQIAGKTSAPIATLHINTILFLLVALAGFMGSMVHLASSFTNYIGSEQFKRSWILWYFVKPFTAAGVAIIFFLVLKAGLLSVDSGGGINPYGIVIMAAFAGLFTDKATIKLEEIFTTLFKPKDERPDKLDAASFSVDSVDPKELLIAGENKVVIKGKGFEKNKLVVKIDNAEINEEKNNRIITPELISFHYKVDPVAQDKKEFSLTIEDTSGAKLYASVLSVQQVSITEDVEEAVG